MIIKTKKKMSGWYELYDNEGHKIGDTDNFQGFWKGNVKLNGKMQSVAIVSETKKGFIKQFDSKYGHLFE